MLLTAVKSPKRIMTSCKSTASPGRPIVSLHRTCSETWNRVARVLTRSQSYSDVRDCARASLVDSWRQFDYWFCTAEPEVLMVRTGVDAVTRALAILKAFDPERAAMTLTQIADATDLYKSTVLRLAASLEAGGFLVRGTNRLFRPGPELWRLGALYQRGLDLGDLIRTLAPSSGRGYRRDRILLHRGGRRAHLPLSRQFSAFGPASPRRGSPIAD
ncbi:hypothetical protein ACVWZV_000281 [Bradyrhizobium sp. GM5.1]